MQKKMEDEQLAEQKTPVREIPVQGFDEKGSFYFRLRRTIRAVKPSKLMVAVAGSGIKSWMVLFCRLMFPRMHSV